MENQKKQKALEADLSQIEEHFLTLSVLVKDKQKELKSIVTVIAKEQGMVIRLEHNPFVSMNQETFWELVITMEVFGHEHKEKIVHALQEQGYNPKIV